MVVGVLPPSLQSFAVIMLHADRLLPADPGTRRIARAIYEQTTGLPIVSPHGHVPRVAVRGRRDHRAPGPRAGHPGPLPAPDAPQPGRAARAPRSAALATAAEVETDGRRDLADLRRRTTTCSGPPPRSCWLDHTLAEVLGVSVALRPGHRRRGVRPPRRRRSPTTPSGRVRSTSGSASSSSPPPTRRSIRSRPTPRSRPAGGRAGSYPPSARTTWSIPTVPTSSRTWTASPR